MRRFSHLHLLVKRSRRNNRDSLPAIEIPRVGLLSPSISFPFLRLSLSFSRALRRLALFYTEPRILSCIWMKLFCREPKKRHAVKRLALIHSRSQPTSSLLPPVELRGSRDDNSKLVPGVPFGPFVCWRYRFEESAHVSTTFHRCSFIKQISDPADLTRK